MSISSVKNEVQQNGRIAYFDNLKALGMLLVVIGHFVSQSSVWNEPGHKQLFLFIYSFHMPLFFLVSGFFHKNKNILKKVITYIAYGYLCKVLLYITNICLGKNPQFHFFWESGLPWFLFVLAYFVFATWLVRNIDKKIVLVVACLLPCFSGYFPWINDTLCLSRAIVYFPFYFIGTLLTSDTINKIRKYQWLAFLTLLIYALLVFQDYKTMTILAKYFTGRNPFPISHYDFAFLFRMFAFIIALALCLAIMALVPNQIYSWTWIGGRTLQIYLWHRVLLYFIIATNLDVLILGLKLGGGVVWLALSVLVYVLCTLKFFLLPFKMVESCISLRLK